MTDNIQILNDIEKAALLCEKDYSHDEIIDILKTEDDFEKQICILNLNTLKNQSEADLLVHQLTGHTSLIREAAASKICEFIQTNPLLKKLFLAEKILDDILKAVNDINPNICRMICAALPILFEEKTEKKGYFLNKLYRHFEDIFNELEKLKRSNWYTKKLFNLYWGLEALALLNPSVDERLECILCKAAAIKEYTIREKTAMVLALLPETSAKINEIKQNLKADTNFYVKRYSQSF